MFRLRVGVSLNVGTHRLVDNRRHWSLFYDLKLLDVDIAEEHADANRNGKNSSEQNPHVIVSLVAGRSDG